jgi:hypothetical protein
MNQQQRRPLLLLLLAVFALRPLHQPVVSARVQVVCAKSAQMRQQQQAVLLRLLLLLLLLLLPPVTAQLVRLWPVVLATQLAAWAAGAAWMWGQQQRMVMQLLLPP